MRTTASVVDGLNWDDVTGGKTPWRAERAKEALGDHSVDIGNLRLEECSDERTGRRYGNAHCRTGRAVKLGGGGRNKGDAYAYQVWLVWN